MKNKRINKKRVRALTAEERRTSAANLYSQGLVQAAIAQRLGVSQVAVSKMLKTIREEWKQQRISDLDAAIQTELAKIDDVELNAWEGWQRSCLDAEQYKKVEGDKISQEFMVKGQSGNPKFLDVVLKCIERRCKLIGLDEPQKFEFTGEIKVLADDDWYDNKQRVIDVEATHG